MPPNNPKSKYLALFVLLIIPLFAFFIYLSIKSPRIYENTENLQNETKSKSEQTLGQSIKEINEDGVNPSEKFKVVRVVDGDTIELENGQKVRYIGIDTPEVVDPRKPIQCFGSEASNKNRELVEGKEVYLEKDISETDKYGRLLRYVFAGDIFVNDYLVRQGFAYSSSYPPDIKYQEQFVNAQNAAREENRGLWDTCFGTASDPTNQPQTVSDPNGCSIKGNISSSGEKIYHVPGQKYYDKTQINGSKGEHWFCTEEEAISAGWRKSKI